MIARWKRRHDSLKLALGTGCGPRSGGTFYGAVGVTFGRLDVHRCVARSTILRGSYKDRTSNWVSTVGPIAQLDRAADSYLLVGSSILSGAATFLGTARVSNDLRARAVIAQPSSGNIDSNR